MTTTQDTSQSMFTDGTLRTAAGLATDAYRPLWTGPSGEESTGEAVARHLDAARALLDRDGWERLYTAGANDLVSRIPATDESMTVDEMLRILLDIVRDDIASSTVTQQRTLFTALQHIGSGDDGDSDTCYIAGEVLTLIVQALTGSPTARATPWSERLGRTHADITALLNAGARFARTYGPRAS
ncbi:hypothetical protein ACFC34_38685 [Streptomyces sp. NPDC056053]|uniref:DUF6197 family protein n=1 Tax=Streptomyces sp. NPDC056053 TaxID=3345696 RepID=UPI0035DB81CA